MSEFYTPIVPQIHEDQYKPIRGFRQGRESLRERYYRETGESPETTDGCPYGWDRWLTWLKVTLPQ